MKWTCEYKNRWFLLYFSRWPWNPKWLYTLFRWKGLKVCLKSNKALIWQLFPSCPQNPSLFYPKLKTFPQNILGNKDKYLPLKSTEIFRNKEYLSGRWIRGGNLYVIDWLCNNNLYLKLWIYVSKHPDFKEYWNFISL